MNMMRWIGQGTFEEITDNFGTLLVADSWFVLNGTVSRLDLHQQRFLYAISRYGMEGQEFWQAAITLLPRQGAWFPRIELVDHAGNFALQINIRPAPPRDDTIRAYLYTGTDPRTHPYIKGPDLAALTQFRSQLQLPPHSDAVLCFNNIVHEGTTTNIMWWENNTLCTPALHLPILPGTTCCQLLQYARKHGYPIQFAPISYERLHNQETWLVNALHGVRLVTQWLNCDITPGEGKNFLTWRNSIEQHRQPLPPLPPLP